MTAAEVILLVRETMNDDHEESGYRFDDAELLRELNDAQDELVKDRPDLLLAADGTIQTVTPVTATTTVLLVGTDYRQALASAVCKKLYVKDGEDDQNITLAGAHQQIYQSEI